MNTANSQSNSARGRVRAVRRVLLITLVLNAGVAAAKLTYGLLVGSLAVVSDAVHSILDGSANILGLLTVGASAAPPDENHPYGHQKVEIIAALFLGALIAAGAMSFGWSAVQSLARGGSQPEIGVGGFLIVGGTLVVNIFVAAYESRMGKALESPYLRADAAHTASDIFTTLGVLASMGLSAAGITWADPVGALIILVVIGRVAWEVVSENVAILLDSAVISPDRIRDIVLVEPGAHDCHKIRSRGLPGAIHVDLHLQVDGALTVHEAHELSHRVEERLKREFEGLHDATIHVEPEDDPAEAL